MAYRKETTMAAVFYIPITFIAFLVIGAVSEFLNLFLW
jgi:hypothetical protein